MGTIRDTGATCLHALFASQVRRSPDAIAVASGDAELTYRELDARANGLAHRLRAAGVGPDVPVAFCVSRTEAAIVAILGILKAGGCYVPIDPSYPEERRTWIVEDSRARVVLGDRDLAELEGSSSAPDVDVTPDHLAYIIYTSGSTGRPKGSPIPHRNVVRLMRTTEAWFRFDERDVWTVFHSFAFDFSVWEVWGALLYGGRAIVVPHLTSRSPEDMLDLIRAHGVTVLNQTPSAFRQLMHAATASDQALPLRWVIFGGEALDLPALAPWFARFGDAQPRLVNMYGITETTVHVTYRALTADDARSPRSLIGQPLPDLTLHVLDDALRPAATDDIGELYVGGAGLARGYLGLPALTAERFVPDPFSSTPGARLYRSGDLGRRLVDGDLEYLGRADFQLKLRGFRIEAGEIENALRAHPGVRDAVVIAREDVPGDQRLVAYVIAHAAPPTPDALREHLRPVLPEYMIPSAFVPLAALPLTGNGKLDRAALPAPAAAPRATEAEPRTDVEATIAAIWAELLGVDDVELDQDFFSAGGHSLLLTQLAVRVRQALGVELPLRTLFDSPSVRGVAATIEEELARADQLLAEIEAMSPEEVEALLAESDK